MESVLCPECGAVNPIDASVCESCGADLAAVRSLIDNANSHYNEALALAHSGRLDEAIAQLEAALALSSDQAVFHNLLGTVYAQKGLYSEAIRAWERALALDPEAEKAFKNIEKARHMEEEAFEEEEARPYVMTSYIASGVAAVLFIVTLVSFFMWYSISSGYSTLEDENDLLATKAAAAESTTLEWKSRYEALSEKFPGESVDSVLKRISDLESLVDTREAQLERLREQRTTDQQNFQAQVASLEQEKNTLRTQLQRINTLEAESRVQQAEIAKLSSELAETKQQLTLTTNELNQKTSQLASVQTILRETRNEHERELNLLRARYDTNIETLRTQSKDNLDEIARYERLLSDWDYANGLVVEGIRNMEDNRFDLALQNAIAAQERIENHAVAVFLQSMVEDIQNDPVEMELRRQEKLDRDQRMADLTQTLGERMLNTASGHLRDGNFNEAIDQARRAMTLDPSDENLQKRGLSIINDANEGKRQVVFIIEEARKFIRLDDFDRAERELNKALKLSAGNSEARQLLAEIQANEESE